MQFSKRGNVLLLELLIVIVFFMIGATILMRMFGRSHMMSRRADALTRSVGEASSLADTLMASGDVQTALDRMRMSIHLILNTRLNGTKNYTITLSVAISSSGLAKTL